MQVYSNELYHYGVVGMKWGVRRFQNPDGSLKAAGQKRYNQAKTAVSNASGKAKAVVRRPVDAVKAKTNSLTDEQKAKIKKGVKIGLAVAGTALAAYGAYKIGSKAMARHELSGRIKAQKIIADRKILQNKITAGTLRSENAGYGYKSIYGNTGWTNGSHTVYNYDGRTGKQWSFNYRNDPRDRR